MEIQQTAEAQPGTGEVRTFLIADVRGYTRYTLEHGDEAAALLATRFAEITQEVVSEHGGEVIELRGDEALAVFTSGRQALRAAVGLQARYALATQSDPATPLHVGIGLDIGEAVPVKGGYRGGALNLAARLCSLASAGEVLASEGVVHIARKVEGLEYAIRGLVELKGLTEKVRVIEITTLANQLPADVQGEETVTPTVNLPIGGFLGALPSESLVAREAELQTILSSVDVVTGGSGRLVLLAGEPGIGKTRLAQEVTLEVRNRGFVVATGRCYEPQQAVAFYPFLEALGAAYDAAPTHVRSEAGRRWPYLSHLLPELSGGAGLPSSRDPDEQQRLFRAVTAFIVAIAETTPVALMIDDLHWADGATLDLLQHLARHTRSHPVLLLGAYRDIDVQRQHPLRQALRDLGREHLVERVLVRRLGQEGTAALMAAGFDETEVSEEFASLVHHQTEGNPFFVQEVLRAMIERGDIFQIDGGWERREISELSVPESIRDAVGERLSRLTQQTQEVLSEASVLGPSFRFEDLQAVGGRSEAHVEAALEEATGAGLVRFAGKEEYTFNHALTQHALYAELSPRVRRRLHLAIGEALERLPASRSKPGAAVLAWHFLQADDAERALIYAIQAGDAAEAVFAHGEAEHHYATVLELAREQADQPRETEALEKLGTVLGNVARYDEAIALLERAAERHRQSGEARAEIRVIVEIGTLERGRGRSAEGIARLEPMGERFEASGASPELAMYYATLERLYFATAQYANELVAAKRASALAHQVGDTYSLALAEIGHGTALQMLGHNHEGTQVMEAVLPLVEQSSDPWATFRILSNLGSGYERVGDLRRNSEYCARALTFAEQSDNPWAIAFGAFNLGTSLFALGDWEEAGHYLDRAVELARGVESSWWGVYPFLGLGELLMLRGEWEEACQILRETLGTVEQSGDLQAARFGARVLATLNLADGQGDAALALLEPLLDGSRLEEAGVADLLPIVAEAYLAVANQERAEVVLCEVIQKSRDQGLNLTLVDALRVQGKLRTAQSRWEDAQAAFDEALGLARDMQYPHMEARILAAYGMMFIVRGDQQTGRPRLEEALVIFQRLGATKEVEYTRRLLDSAS